MLSFGEQIYRPTARDEETLLVEPFFRSVAVTAVGVSPVCLAVVPIPIDRCIYIDRISFTGQSWVNAVTWVRFFTELDARFAGGLIEVCDFGNDISQLISDGNIERQANQPVHLTANIKTVFPPGMATIRFNAFTPAKTIDATAVFEIHAYFIPPGRIGRR